MDPSRLRQNPNPGQAVPASSPNKPQQAVPGGRPANAPPGFSNQTPQTQTPQAQNPHQQVPQQNPQAQQQRPQQQAGPSAQLPGQPLRSDWFTIGPTTFQKTVFYQNSDWSAIDFKKSRMFGARFGGPVAVLTQDSYDSDEAKFIEIFASSGKPIGQINITDIAHLIVGMGWNDTERFVVVTSDSRVFIFTVQGDISRTWKMGGVAEEGLISAKIWGTGLVVLTRKMDLLAVYNFDKPVEKQLRRPALTQPPSSWTVIEPQLSPNGQLQVLLCTVQTQSVLFVSESGVVDVGVSAGPFHHIAVSPSGKMVALYTKERDNLIWIVTTDFCNELVRFTVSNRAPGVPLQFEWLSNDAIVCTWETELDYAALLVTPDAAFSTMHFDQPIHIVSECDGLRLIGQAECGFINKASNAQKFIYMPGMTNEAIRIYKASQYFHKEQNGPKCDEIMRAMSTQDIESGVNVLTVAAGFEFDKQRQQDLLLAAALGKSTIEDAKGGRFDSMCRDIRVLNAVRDEEIGILISFVQYQILSPQLLINRLLNRDMHHLAFKICSYLNLPKDAVLVHWATRKVASKLPDDDILSQIVEKTRLLPGVSYAAVAYAAYQKNKPDLAASLLDFEAKAEEQVPLLIKMEKHDLSLEKACLSGDTDLIHLALLVLNKTLPQTEFYTLLRSNDEAKGMWESYCRQTNRQGLLTMYRAGGGNSALAREEIIDAHNTSNLDERLERLKVASKIFKQTDKFAHAQTQDEIRLLEIQRELEKTIAGSIFVGSSLYCTLYRTLMLGLEKQSKKIREEFKISNVRWWCLKIRAYTVSGKWDSLRRFSEQKSPIGYKPFFEACYEAKNHDEALFYVAKIHEEAERIKAFVLLGKWMEAVEGVKVMKADPGDVIAWMKTKATHNVWKMKVQELEDKWAAGELGSVFGDYEVDLNILENLDDAELPFDTSGIEETLNQWTESFQKFLKDK